MKLPNLKAIAIAVFAIVAAVAVALRCPVFRNPGTYVTVGYLKYIVDVHRKR